MPLGKYQHITKHSKKSLTSHNWSYDTLLIVFYYYTCYIEMIIDRLINSINEQ